MTTDTTAKAWIAYSENGEAVAVGESEPLVHRLAVRRGCGTPSVVLADREKVRAAAETIARDECSRAKLPEGKSMEQCVGDLTCFLTGHAVLGQERLAAEARGEYTHTPLDGMGRVVHAGTCLACGRPSGALHRGLHRVATTGGELPRLRSSGARVHRPDRNALGRRARRPVGGVQPRLVYLGDSGGRMKSARPHRVPFSGRAAGILNQAQSLFGRTVPVFPGRRDAVVHSSILSELVRELGIKGTTDCGRPSGIGTSRRGCPATSPKRCARTGWKTAPRRPAREPIS